MAEPAAKPDNKENVISVASTNQENEDEDSYDFNPVCENCAG